MNKLDIESRDKHKLRPAGGNWDVQLLSLRRYLKYEFRTRVYSLRHGARSREIWHSPRFKNLVVIKQFFS